jgi:hypothetical protein
VANGARTHLTLYLTGSYLLLIVYASLYPLTGWRDSGDDAAVLPRCGLAALLHRLRPGDERRRLPAFRLPLRRRHAPPPGALPAWLLAALCGGALSLVLELLQNYLPNRIPSNLDLACNATGALLGGGLGAQWGARLLEQGRLADLRRQLMMDGYGVDIGVLLVAAWLMTQLSPGIAAVRQRQPAPDARPAAGAALPRGTLRRPGNPDRRRRPAGGGTGVLHAAAAPRPLADPRPAAACAVLVKTAAHALLMGPAAALGWITPGNSLGLGIGLALWWSATFLGAPLQRAVAALALLLATVMVNVAPENPYLQNMLQIWNPGQFLNFNGLTRLICPRSGPSSPCPG